MKRAATAMGLMVAVMCAGHRSVEIFAETGRVIEPAIAPSTADWHVVVAIQSATGSIVTGSGGAAAFIICHQSVWRWRPVSMH